MNIELIATKVKENFSNYIVNVEDKLHFLKDYNGVKPLVNKEYENFLDKFPDMKEKLSDYKNGMLNNKNIFSKDTELNVDLSILELRDKILKNKEDVVQSKKSSVKQKY